MDADEKLFQQMWKTYFKSIAIKERLNPKLHRQHMPARFWKYMPEKVVSQDALLLLFGGKDYAFRTLFEMHSTDWQNNSVLLYSGSSPIDVFTCFGTLPAIDSLPPLTDSPLSVYAAYILCIIVLYVPSISTGWE